jgi:hypothetical protein
MLTICLPDTENRFSFQQAREGARPQNSLHMMDNLYLPIFNKYQEYSE